jgi:hypothetical protein
LEVLKFGGAALVIALAIYFTYVLLVFVKVKDVILGSTAAKLIVITKVVRSDTHFKV